MMIMKLLCGISLFFLTACSVDAGNPMTTHQIDEITVEGIRLSVYLPPGYDENEAYPVAYFNDGQTLFGNLGQTWALQETLDRLISKKQIRPIIVVGIHSGIDRTSNYVPYRDDWIVQNWGNYIPSAAVYTQKIINSVIPYIDEQYATKADQKNRAMVGSSLGGLHATWALLYYPEYFSFSASFSPSFWVADYKIFQDANKARPDQKFYFDIGTSEWNYYVPMIPALGQPYGEDVFYYEVPDGRHTLLDWGSRAKNALLLFAGKTPEDYTWDVEIEVIKSQSRPNTFFLRLNPIIKFTNDLHYSLSIAAKYELKNPEDGEVKEDGRFEFINPKDLNVIVSYKEERKEITVSYKEIERRKKE